MPSENEPQLDAPVSSAQQSEVSGQEESSAPASGAMPNNNDASPTASPPPAATLPTIPNMRSYRLSARWLSFTFYTLVYPAGSNLFTFFDWIKSHNAEGSLLEAWRAGVLSVEEGFPTPDATLGTMVLKICSSVVIYTPILMLSYAYRVLYDDFNAEGEDVLAPPENGLLGESIRASGFGWISSFMALLFGKPRRKNPAMFVLKEAFAVCLIANAFPIIFFLMFVLFTALRVELPSTTEIRELPIATPFNLSITQSACHPYDLSTYVTDRRGLPDAEWLTFNKPCGIASFGPNFVPLDEVDRLASNMSTTFNITTLADASDLSVLVLRDVNETTAKTKFRMQTFGARAVCSPDAQFYASKDERFVTLRRGKGSRDQELRWPQRTSSRACVDTTNPNACPSVTVEALRDAPWRFMHYPIDTAAPGPFELGLKFLWPLYEPSSNSNGLWTAAQASCHVSYYNVTLEHTLGSYTLIDEAPSQRFLTDGFSRHLRFGMIGGFLDDDVLGAFFAPAHTDAGRLAFLNQEVSRLAIASAGAFTTGTGPTLEQSNVLRRVLAQYPARAVLVFLLLQASFTVFAFVLCLAFSLRRRSDPELVAQGQTPPPTATSPATAPLPLPVKDTAPASSILTEKTSIDNEVTSRSTDSACPAPAEVQDLQYRISIRKFVIPLIVTGAAVLSILQVLGRVFASTADEAEGNLTIVAATLLYFTVLSSPIMLYFYVRRLWELYLQPQVAAPRDGLLGEALRIIRLSFFAKALKIKTTKLEGQGPKNSILREALIVFLSIFSTIFLIAITSIALSLKSESAHASTPNDTDAEGSMLDDVLGKEHHPQPDPEADAFPFWPSLVVFILMSVYAMQILLVSLAQSLVPVNRAAPEPETKLKDHSSQTQS